jgi:hypothetical protein
VTLVVMLGCAARAEDMPAAERASRATEARMLVGAMARSAELQAARGVAVTQPAGPTPPVGTCCEGARGRCRPTAAWWDLPGWRAVRFEVHQPHAYSYEYRPDERGFTALAYGDLDCDGVVSTFSIRGEVGTGGMIELGPLRTTSPLE